MIVPTKADPEIIHAITVAWINAPACAIMTAMD